MVSIETYPSSDSSLKDTHREEIASDASDKSDNEMSVLCSDVEP